MWASKELSKDTMYNTQKMHEKYLKFKEQEYKVAKLYGKTLKTFT